MKWSIFQQVDHHLRCFHPCDAVHLSHLEKADWHWNGVLGEIGVCWDSGLTWGCFIRLCGRMQLQRSLDNSNQGLVRRVEFKQRGQATAEKPVGGRRRTGIFRFRCVATPDGDRRIPVRQEVFSGAFPFRRSSIFRRTAPTLTCSGGDRFGLPLRRHRNKARLYRIGD
jgi:hypothetical protein